MKKKCYHYWIELGFEINPKAKKHRIVATWSWCKNCGATRHIVFNADYFGLEKDGIYIRHVGKKEKTKLIKKFEEELCQK